VIVRFALAEIESAVADIDSRVSEVTAEVVILNFA
jgi:hypothetical protein